MFKIYLTEIYRIYVAFHGYLSYNRGTKKSCAELRRLCQYILYISYLGKPTCNHPQIVPVDGSIKPTSTSLSTVVMLPLGTVLFLKFDSFQDLCYIYFSRQTSISSFTLLFNSDSMQTRT